VTSLQYYGTGLMLSLLVVIGGNLVWTGQNPTDNYSASYELVTKLGDASGLPKGSYVVVAGLAKGQVTAVESEGGYTRITFRISREIDVFTNGVVIKKTSSLLGESYLEIAPGEANQQMPDGTSRTFIKLGPDCDGYDSIDPKEDERCKLLPNAIELPPTDELLRQIEQLVPKRVLIQAPVDSLRAIINRPLNLANRLSILGTGKQGP
jgi:hypothetical protein